MKKMKRLVAVLLAGVLALAMLTACGGGDSTPSIGAQAEAATMKYLNAMAGTEMQNDPTMKAQICKVLNTIDENGKFASDEIPGGISGSGKELSLTIYMLSEEQFNDGELPEKVSAIEVTPERLNQIKKATEEVSKGSGEDDAKVTAVAVGTVVKNGKTYIGVAFTVTVENQQ